MKNSKERDKKGFLSEQHKETEENNTMGKTRDLFKKIRDTKGHRTGKGQFLFQSQRKAMPKNPQTTTQLNSSQMLVK